MQATIKAIGYCRVSTEEQAKEGFSLPAQEDKLRKYAAAFGIELVEIVVDAGVSAKSLDRPGLEKALALLQSGQAEGLLVAKLDRLSRNLGDWHLLVKRYFSDKGKKQLFSVEDAIDTRTAGGRLVLNIRMAVSQWELEVIGERTSAALQYKISEGERVGRVRYGYVVTEEGKLIEDPRQQAGIAKMHELRKSGLSLREIGKTLDRDGFPSKDGKPWSAASIKQILDRRQAADAT